MIRTGGVRQLRKRWVLGAAFAAALNIGASTGLGGSTELRQLSIGDVYLGPQMARAEIVLVRKGVVHDLRLDQGRITAVNAASLDLAERDGTHQLIPVSTSTKFIVSGAPATLADLKPGMVAFTTREGDQPAQGVRAHPPARR